MQPKRTGQTKEPPNDKLKGAAKVCPYIVQRLSQLTSRQQQTQRTLLNWLRVEYGIEKPSNKLLALADLDSNTWVSEVKRIRGKKQPLSSAGLHALREEYTRTIAPARALVAETLTLERTLSDLVNQAYALTPVEIALMRQTAPPRMPYLAARRLILRVWQLTRCTVPPAPTMGSGTATYALPTPAIAAARKPATIVY